MTFLSWFTLYSRSGYVFALTFLYPLFRAETYLVCINVYLYTQEDVKLL